MAAGPTEEGPPTLAWGALADAAIDPPPDEDEDAPDEDEDEIEDIFAEADKKFGMAPGTMLQWWKDYQKTAAGVAEKHENLVFDTTPTLRYLRAHARHCMVSPWALLGVAIPMALADTHPNLRIPGYIGGPASLNFFTALVGPSGVGKSAAVSAFDATMLPGESIERLTPSSGEGIVALFVDINKKTKAPEQVRTQVVSVVDEIATLGAMQQRKGSTLPSTLRSIWSGSGISQYGADPTRRRKLAKDSYRFCMITGVQPSTAAILLDDEGMGTPQRFLWMPATDTRADENAPAAGYPPITGTIDPSKAFRLGAEITFPGHVYDYVRSTHRVAMHGPRRHPASVAVSHRSAVDALDGHALLTRLKVCAGLAVLHGTTVVSEQMWSISSWIMLVSDAVRDELVQHQITMAKDNAKRLGSYDLDRAQAAKDAQVARAAQRIAKHVQGAEEPVKRQALRDLLGRDKDVLKEAIAQAITLRWIIEEEYAHPDGSGKMATQYVPGAVRLPS